jgi:hypothetical protein
MNLRTGCAHLYRSAAQFDAVCFDYRPFRVRIITHLEKRPVGKKIVYRYSYTVHGNGYSYSFDEAKKLPLTVNGSTRFVVNGDKIRILDEKGKEHKRC